MTPSHRATISQIVVEFSSPSVAHDNNIGRSAENQDKPTTTGVLASPKLKLWLYSQAFLQERGMELPQHTVKIRTATQQIKHLRIMAIWMF